MIEAAELLATARLLIRPNGIAVPTQASLRRSVSTAYYALYHHVLAAAADQLVGAEFKGKAAAYSLIYRAISHTRVAEVCGKIDRDKLSDTVRDQLGRETISKPMREVADSFQTLRQLRELADYEPGGSFTLEDAEFAVEEADFAIQQLNQTTPSELRDVLALMLAGTRR